MRREIIEKIEIPQGIEVDIKEDRIAIKKNGNETGRKYEGFSVKKNGNEIIIECKRATKKEKKQIKTLRAHIVNIFKGMEKKYEYKLQVCAVHFPMSVSVDKTKCEVLVKNFLGGVKPRIAKIKGDVEVKVDKEIITVIGENKEDAGQTAANIEKATRVINRDRRTFQDGVYIIEKPGEKIF